MKKVEIKKKIEVKKTVELFEVGDLIKYSVAEVTYYGLVLENQNMTNINKVYVFSFADGKCKTWTGIRDCNSGHTQCSFVAHLDNHLFSSNLLLHL